MISVHLWLSLFASMRVLFANQDTRPNIVLIVTDDQDIELKGMEPLEKTRKLIADAGVEFVNAFVTTPVCCPSRASILTGRYAHNHNTRNNSVSGGCYDQRWTKYFEPIALPVHMKRGGYTTFFSGKYLNRYGKTGHKGFRHVPLGWDYWYALLGNSVYYNYTLSANGNKEIHGNASTDYLTNLIAEKAVEFLHNQSHVDENKNVAPFFMMLCTPAPHSPFTPFASFKHNFSDVIAYRSPNFNVHSNDKHWLLTQTPRVLSDDVIMHIDHVYRNRWRTLLSVDDLVESVVRALQTINASQNTYIIFTSDNGFHVGQFCLPRDKRQPYEFDVKVPLLISGPGLRRGVKAYSPALNIDLAPTILDLAHLPIAKDMDGQSLWPLLQLSDWASSHQSHLHRRHFLIEYWGEGNNRVPEDCPHLQNAGVAECYPACICEDAFNNTYSCVRSLHVQDNGVPAYLNEIYCLFHDDVQFEEYYNLNRDPYQLHNAAQRLSRQKRMRLRNLLRRLKRCSGHQCHRF